MRSQSFRALLALALVLGCRSARIEPMQPVEPSASKSMFEAWEAARHPNFSADESLLDAALSSARKASELEPLWAPPKRFIDEWEHRRALTLPDRYSEHVGAALDGSAAGAYLAARLGGSAADRRMERATRLDPALGWGWHGKAWREFSRGRTGTAIDSGYRAVRLARESGELAHFSWALARYLRADERTEGAREVLESALLQGGSLALRSEERVFIGVELAVAELESADAEDVRRGTTRALGLLGQSLLETESLELALRLQTVENHMLAGEEVRHRLTIVATHGASDAARSSASRVLNALAGTTRATEGSPLPAWRERLRQAYSESPQKALTVVEAWCAALPTWLVDGEGLPKREELRDAVLATRAAVAGEISRSELIDWLGRAGWFREALGVAESLRGPDGGVSPHEEYPLRFIAALGAVKALAHRIDAQEAFLRAGAVDETGVESIEGGRLESLVELDQEIARLLPLRSGSEASNPSMESPRIRYGPLGGVLHPGPTFSAEDAAQGRGVEGEAVPGIARRFLDLGRFALIGQGVGQGGPDATVLRIVHVEERSGEHVGRAFRGTVFWCDGADVPGRFGRRGASISGAALHEGYYVDLEMVAREKAQWDALRRRFDGRSADVQRALAVRGASVPIILRTETTPALGAADRMRLAVMSEEGGSALREISLGDLAHVVATHEEGHLCDRGQWYPLSFGRVLRLISFAGANNFSGARISRALEERAQLVALCDVEDVRLAWIDLLDAAETGGGGGAITPHGKAYRRLLQGLIDRLDAEWEDGGWRDQDISPTRRWIDQLHRIEPEALRGLARRAAADRF